MLKGIAQARFMEFLYYREKLQEHVVCFDELDIYGWYLDGREQFKEYADRGMMIDTIPNMGTIFNRWTWIQ